MWELGFESRCLARHSDTGYHAGRGVPRFVLFSPQQLSGGLVFRSAKCCLGWRYLDTATQRCGDFWRRSYSLLLFPSGEQGSGNASLYPGG